MTSWLSPEVPYYVDIDSLAYLVYQAFYDSAPKKSGNMADGIQYTIVGSQIYFWDDVIYAHYQDTVTAYEGWWHSELPATYEYWLNILIELNSDNSVYDIE